MEVYECESVLMQPINRDAILFKTDPSQNMQRFYALSIQPSLFGGQSLVRNWGRIGSKGQLRIDLYEDTSAAVQALNALARAKRARGYIELT